MKLWYLSFANVTEFLGCCVVRANSLEGAMEAATREGCNPGGEIMGWAIPGDFNNPYPIGKLLSKADLERIDGAAPVALKELDEKTKTLMISLGQTICEDCN